MLSLRLHSSFALFPPLLRLPERLQNIAMVQAGFADHGIPLSLLVVDMDW